MPPKLRPVSPLPRPSARPDVRIDDLRHERFVGRSSELETLRALLDDESESARALYLFGPPGIGKTSLLWEFAHAARELNANVTYLDARTVTPTPRALLDELGDAMGLAAGQSPLRALTESQTPQAHRYLRAPDFPGRLAARRFPAVVAEPHRARPRRARAAGRRMADSGRLANRDPPAGAAKPFARGEPHVPGTPARR